MKNARPTNKNTKPRKPKRSPGPGARKQTDIELATIKRTRTTIAKSRATDSTEAPKRKASDRSFHAKNASFKKKTSSTSTSSRGRSASASKEGVRINKYLADAGIGARRSVEEFITGGLVKVNGQIVTDLSTRIFLEDFVTVNGEPITDRKFLTYFLLNKPKDIITTSSDELGRETVLDIVRSKYRIFPVGRLDRNTTGALLITNDGDLAYRLTHPSYEIPREYKVGLDRELDFKDARKISHGLELEDGKTGACEVIVDIKDHTKITMMIKEGRNREVRRIFESLGYDVRRLDRRRFATLSTSGLKRGEYRQLTKTEVRDLRSLVGLDLVF